MHEQILPALRRANVPVRWTEVTVRHTGYTDPALRERKLQRDCKILEAELAERPENSGQWSVASECGGSGERRERTRPVLQRSTRASTAISPCATSPPWLKSAATAPRRGGLWRMVRDACPGDAEAMASGEA